MKCADQYIARQRRDWPPEVLEMYPNQEFEGTPAADLFWFTNHKGMGGTLHFSDRHHAFGWHAWKPVFIYIYIFIFIYIYIYIHAYI